MMSRQVVKSSGLENQTKTSLSTTKAEYSLLFQALCDVLSLIHLLRELSITIAFEDKIQTAHYAVHENNLDYTDLVETPRKHPRTKHIALKYHHLQTHTKKKSVSVEYINTKEQVADIFTKAFGDFQFSHLMGKLIGW